MSNVCNLMFNMISRICVVLASFAVLANYVAGQKKVVCYYGSWATYRPSLGKFDVEHINTDLCTHLVYTFVGIDTQGTVISLDPWLDFPENWGRNNFGAFNALKQKNPNIKTFLAVGGWNEGSAKYSIMAASPTLRKNFVDSALKLIQDHGFDGLDIDWEYPNGRDTVYGSADVDNFTTLLKELREEFDKYGLLLSAAVGALPNIASLSYDIPAISQYLDLINLMTYDMYGAWNTETGHNAGIHMGLGDEGAVRENLATVDVAVEYWLNAGCPPEKLVLGVPFYGRSFLLTNANVNSVRAPTSGAGIAGIYSGTNGFVGYNEFCVLLQTEPWTQEYDDLAKVPFAYSGRNWVSYDDPDSMVEKVKYGLQNNISGIMIWSIETDDFHGLCGEDYPLLRAINRALDENVDESGPSTDASSSVASSTEASTSTASPTTTDACPTINYSSTTMPADANESDIVCTQEGYIPSPTTCSSFYMCFKTTNGDLVPAEFECPLSLHWDQNNLLCNHPNLANCRL